MNQSDLDTLLDKYYSGTTSSEEEEMILKLLKSDDCPDKYSLEKEMFATFEIGDKIPEPSTGFESDIMARIDAEEKKDKLITLKRKLYSIVAVAASLLIIASSYLVLLQNRGPADTFSDPELAYIQVLETLRMVSDGLSSGKEEMAHLAIIDKASENIGMLGTFNNEARKQLEPLSYINRSINILEEASSNKNDTN